MFLLKKNYYLRCNFLNELFYEEELGFPSRYSNIIVQFLFMQCIAFVQYTSLICSGIINFLKYSFN